MRLIASIGVFALALTGCGYHVSGHADMLPKTIKTIAVPAFGNNTTRYKLTERMAQSITREFNTRTRYRVVGEERNADAVLRGTVLNVLSFPTTFDTSTGRAAGVQINVIVKVDLTEKATGKVLYSNGYLEIRERYEISTNSIAYFEESEPALNRLSQQVAQAVVSAILESFLMTPLQLLTQIKNGALAPVYLFAGPEMYRRRVCRKQMVEKFLPEELREEGYVRFDLDEVSVRDVIDDASSFSLFTPKRLLWVSGAEAALPRGGTISDDDPGITALASYVKNPTPDVIVVFDSHRFTFDNEDKPKMERLRKYYAAIPNVVDFNLYTEEEARKLAADLAKRSGLNISGSVLESLVESLGADASRLANEIEKLALFTGGTRAVTEEDIASLAPDARSTTIFALVNALSRRDRATSLDLLETLIRDGEHLPLALTFLATQFRFALVAKEEGLKTAQQLQAHCAKLGVPMWPSRAQQVLTTVNAFSRKQIEQAVHGLYRADHDLRDRPPDDRLVIENLVLSLTR